jgi:DNA invertase Pin-like site-specific DNA recombinase
LKPSSRNCGVAKQNGLFIVREYIESKTAKEPGREIFNQMLLENEKETPKEFCVKPDRLARNSIEGGQIVYLVDTEKLPR